MQQASSEVGETLPRALRKTPKDEHTAHHLRRVARRAAGADY